MTLIFFSLAVFWLHFGTFQGSEWVFSVPGSKIKTKKNKLGKSPKSIEKSPFPFSCFLA